MEICLEWQPENLKSGVSGGRQLIDMGFPSQEGQAIDSSIFDIPHRHTTREENKRIKQGLLPQELDIEEQTVLVGDLFPETIKNSVGTQEIEKAIHKWRQIDRDAQTGLKRFLRVTTDKEDEVLSVPEYHTGYKLHLCSDIKYKLARAALITPANVYDGHMLIPVLDWQNDDPRVYADKGYPSRRNHDYLVAHGFEDEIITKKPHGRDYTDEEKAKNRARSRRRGGCEHIFGDMKGRNFKFNIRTVGYLRAQAKLLLTVLSYNYRRICSLYKKYAFI